MNRDKNGNELPNRKTVRMKGFDYSQPGFYFLTICCKPRGNVMGDVRDAQVYLNDLGKIVYEELAVTNRMRKNNMKIVEGIIMPDHIHLIVQIFNNNDNPNPKDNSNDISFNLRKCSVSSMLAGFKASVTKKIGYSIWQQRMYEHYIRNQHEYENIVNYIHQNPNRWQMKYGNV